MNRWHDWRFRAALAAALLPPTLRFVLAPPGLAEPGWIFAQPGRFLALVLLWPVLEEVIFRGALQPALAETVLGGKEVGGLSVANVATSLVFAAAHLYAHPPFWALLVFFPSLVFGYFRDRHRNLGSPIILHLSYNLGYYPFWAGGGG